MGFLSKIFGKKVTEPVKEPVKKVSYFETEIWLNVRSAYHLEREPYPACPVKGHRDVMWVQSGKLYFAPKKMISMEQVECYDMDIIESFFVNPKDHNEVRLKLVPTGKVLGTGEPLMFRSNSLCHFRELLPEKEYKFSDKIMRLGTNYTTNQSIKLGDLKDVRSGAEFEDYLTTLFKLLGYHAENTKISHDQGVDVLVSKGKIKYGIQAKYYSQPVGNSAVQEILAGREYFHLQKGIVVTNATYTKSAVDLAEKTKIKLIDGTELNRMIKIAKSGKIGNFNL